MVLSLYPMAMYTTALEEVMALRGMDNLQLPNGDLN